MFIFEEVLFWSVLKEFVCRNTCSLTVVSCVEKVGMRYNTASTGVFTL